MKQTYLYLWYHLFQAQRSAQLLFVFLENPRWKTRPPKDNKYVVNQKLEHADDISFREFLHK
jgi:hypothetical protein